jgi:serine protease Do
MSRLLKIIAASLGLTLVAAAPAEHPDMADLVETLEPAVVNIAVVSYEKTGPSEGNMASQPLVTRHVHQASGFFIAASGIIVTNRHAIAGVSEITVTLHDTTRLNACVAAIATQSDIAVLKVDAGGPVATVRFGDSDALRPGDPVFVMGNPLGHGGTVTAGIVSALGRTSPESQFGTFLQIDAPLNEGNSGGPVFNARGELVGVATALFSPGSDGGSVGLGLAIPGNDARLIVDRLLRQGEVRLGWIGVHVQPLTTAIAAAAKLREPAGAIVTAVDDGGPAAQAGLAPGDIVLGIGDAAVLDAHALNTQVAASTVGGAIALTVWRDGARQVVRVVVGNSPADKAPTPAQAAQAEKSSLPVCEDVHVARRDLGLVLGPITTDARSMLGLDAHATGVLVTGVAPNSVAAGRGIDAGSLIVNVERHAVTSEGEVQSVIDAAREAKLDYVLVLVRSQQGLHWIALPLS